MNTPLSGLEIPHELTDPSKIVVIHPGSFYLRLGLASDPQPKEVLHCIARKRKYGHHRDPILVSQSSSSYDHREARLSVASVLASTLTSQGRQRFQSKHYPGKAQIIKLDSARPFFFKIMLQQPLDRGVPVACVVDAGDQKISVSCVEDGISHPDTRIQLNYGGGDISRIYYTLLKDLAFSLLSFGLFSTHRKGEKKSISYTIYVGDEAIIAPSALFHTELLEITGNGNRIELFTPDEGDHEDPHDLLYLNETSRKYTKAGDPSDQAILKSIEACPSDDLKKKMYSCILLVGGGLKFDGITQFLKNKLILQISSSFRSEPMDIIIDAKDTNAEFTTWRGAAVLACLESAQELWIKPREFAKHGQKILRERAPFPWT
ncbi:ACTR8 [Lepeophtheirus salmonis]|uniref:Actin-related protein 8 n=1 Tax=Lepeophtheirus salmonis TaxID=72036 RepID=A0A7R8H4A9_LEPSM|nr:ACTR8 [Lepeophtheirus salmonis]CAF2844740.1 ACTR8 [Lepeophtheirus salmonis]